MKLVFGDRMALTDMETDEDDDFSVVDSDSDEGAKDDNAVTTLGDGCIDRDDTVDNLVLLSPQVIGCHTTTTAVTPALSPQKQIQDTLLVIPEKKREEASLKHTISLLQRRNWQLT